MRRFPYSIITALIILLSCSSLACAEEENLFSHTNSAGVTSEITEKGLVSVELDGTTIASGQWRLMGTPSWATEPPVPSVTPPAMLPGPIQDRSMDVISEQHVRVHHTHGRVTVTYDYVFEGEDLRIVARIQNPHQKADLPAARFGGLTCSINDPTQSRINTYTEADLEDNGLDLFHPSPSNPIGGSYLAIDGCGIGLCPIADMATPTLLWWKPQQESNIYELNYVVSTPVRAEGAQTYQFLIRLSDTTDWKHLLQPWKRRLAGLYGEVRYDPISKPVVYHPIQTQPVEPAAGSGTTLWNCAPGPWGESTNPENPLGYAENEVRFDRQEDVEAYVTRMLPFLKKADALGIVFRQLGGYDPKGLEYAAMFHMAPPEVHDNVKNIIAEQLDKAGMHLGVTGRPDRWPVYTSLDDTEWLELTPDIQQHLNHMWACRLRESIREMGASMFLLEDFGVGADDVRMMEFYRRKFNAQDSPIPSFTAYPSDAMLFFNPCLTSDLSATTQRILRWLVPGTILYQQIESTDPDRTIEMARDAYTSGNGAIVRADVLPQIADAIGDIYAQHKDVVASSDYQPADPLDISMTPPSTHEAQQPSSATEKFTYTTDDGITCTVTPMGVEKITLKDQVLAEGNWTTLSPGKAFTKSTHQTTSLEKLDAQSCRVIQTGPRIRTTFTYRFAGEDLTIRAHVENNHTQADIDITSFGDLTFHFQGKPNRAQLSKHSKWGWLPHPNPRKNLGHMNPGWANRIAGSYGADERYGVGATPLQTGLTRTLINWGGGWGSSDRKLRYSAQKPIPAGGARTFYLKLRLSTNRDWKHLLVPYREFFAEEYGIEPHYDIDHRLVVQEMISAPQGTWITDTNPLSYHKRRPIHTPEGARKWAEFSVSLMEKTNGKGPILWGQCGYQPRRMLFRADFDLLPQPVADNWHIIEKVFEESSRRFGVTVGRAGAMNYRWKWESDNILPLDPNNLGHMQSMARRYRNMMDKGVTMFYLDVFAHRFRAAQAMRYYRNHVLSPDILTYCEHPSDAALPYTGVRGGIRHDKKRGLHIHWGLDRFWYIMNWVMTDIGSQYYSHIHPWPKIKVKVGEKFGNPVYEPMTALSKEDEYRWMFRHRMGVMEARHVIPRHADTYRKVQDEFLTDDGQWRSDIPAIAHPNEDQYKEERKKRIEKERREQKEQTLDDLLAE